MVEGGAPTWPPEYGAQHKRNAYAGFSRHWTDTAQEPAMKQRQMTWVHKTHCPSDARSLFPARSVKPMEQHHPPPRPVPSYWVQTPEAQLGTFSREAEEDKHYRTCQATRCEEWSSVREMLPSKGFPVHHLQERWGTSGTVPPPHTSTRPKQFPHFKSSATVYVDDVYVNNKHLEMPLYRST